jgi:hypothetical protein
MTTAMVDLRLDRLDVIHPGARSWEMASQVRAVSIERMPEEVDVLAE